MLTNTDLPLIIEALLLAAGRCMTIQELSLIFDEEKRPTNQEIGSAIAFLQQQNEQRGVELVKTANGYQFQSKQKFSYLVARLWQERPPKYSRAFLETLALIAYRQPITRGEIEQIRGVTISSSIFKTLQEERGWIRIIGHKDVPGKPALYATTKEFLTYFGLEKLEELPPLPKIMDFLTTEHQTA